MKISLRLAKYQDRRNHLRPGVQLRPAKSGIQRHSVISPEIFKHFIPEEVFSLIDLYLQLADDYPIKGYRHDETAGLMSVNRKVWLRRLIFGALN
jgi:hypothetical protein